MRTVEKERGPEVLVLSNHFPKPKNPKMGIWGLRQALALRRAGVDVTICSLTEWVPRAAGPFLRRSPRLRRIDAWASCPGEGRLEGLEVHWPRWPRHVRGPHAEWCFAHPRVELALSWPWARRKVLQIADDVRPDVVYAHGSAVNGWVAARIQEERGIPFVLQDNDVDELRLAPALPARAAHYREVGGGAKAWVVCGPQMIDDLRAIDPSQDPLLIPYGTEPIEPAHRGEAAAVVLCVCNMLERKQVPQLVRAFARISDRHPGVELRLLGDGPDLPAVREELNTAGLDGRATLLPREADVPAEMARADVFALVGRSEAFGVVYVEAMAAGCAVLCADDAGVLGVVDRDEHVLAVPASDEEAIARGLDMLLSDSSLRRRLAAAGRDHVLSELTWDRHAERLKPVLAAAARP